MSTTTALELLEHADVLTRRLRKSETPTTTIQWETFDDTLYRLLIELVGIEAQHVRTADPSWRPSTCAPAQSDQQRCGLAGQRGSLASHVLRNSAPRS